MKRHSPELIQAGQNCIEMCELYIDVCQKFMVVCSPIGGIELECAKCSGQFVAVSRHCIKACKDYVHQAETHIKECKKVDCAATIVAHLDLAKRCVASVDQAARLCELGTADCSKACLESLEAASKWAQACAIIRDATV